MIAVRKANLSDNILLAEIGKRTFYETWRPVNTEEDMQVYIKKAFDPQLLLNDLTDSKNNTFLIASLNDEVIGYAKLRRDRTYEEFGNERVIEIERIYVLQSFQDKKIGKMLMDKCIQIALEEMFSWIWLGVNIDNHKAINFYKKYGFEIFGEKAFQLGNAVDNDYLMKRRI